MYLCLCVYVCVCVCVCVYVCMCARASESGHLSQFPFCQFSHICGAPGIKIMLRMQCWIRIESESLCQLRSVGNLVEGDVCKCMSAQGAPFQACQRAKVLYESLHASASDCQASLWPTRVDRATLRVRQSTPQATTTGSIHEMSSNVLDRIIDYYSVLNMSWLSLANLGILTFGWPESGILVCRMQREDNILQQPMDEHISSCI